MAKTSASVVLVVLVLPLFLNGYNAVDLPPTGKADVHKIS